MKVEFLSELITQRAPENVKTPWLSGRGPRRQLTEDFVVKLGNKTITVPEGYIFDGSSIPFFLWWLFPPGYDPAWRAAAVHDYLYSHLWRRFDKRFADVAFKSIMLQDGASPLVASLFHKAVTAFGKGGW